MGPYVGLEQRQMATHETSDLDSVDGVLWNREYREGQATKMKDASARR